MTMNLRTETHLWKLDEQIRKESLWNLRLSQRWTHVDTFKEKYQVRQKAELLSQQHQRTHTRPLQSTHTHPPEYARHPLLRICGP